jgi:hypothetical protein
MMKILPFDLWERTRTAPALRLRLQIGVLGFTD